MSRDRVLYVDDHDRSLEIAHALGIPRDRVDWAKHCAEALCILNKHRDCIGVVISDLYIPPSSKGTAAPEFGQKVLCRALRMVPSAKIICWSREAVDYAPVGTIACQEKQRVEVLRKIVEGSVVPDDDQWFVYNGTQECPPEAVAAAHELMHRVVCPLLSVRLLLEEGANLAHLKTQDIASSLDGLRAELAGVRDSLQTFWGTGTDGETGQTAGSVTSPTICGGVLLAKCRAIKKRKVQDVDVIRWSERFGGKKTAGKALTPLGRFRSLMEQGDPQAVLRSLAATEGFENLSGDIDVLARVMRTLVAFVEDHQDERDCRGCREEVEIDWSG